MRLPRIILLPRIAIIKGIGCSLIHLNLRSFCLRNRSQCIRQLLNRLGILTVILWRITIQYDLSQRIGLIPRDRTARARAVQRFDCGGSCSRKLAIIHCPRQVCTVCEKLTTIVELEANLRCSGESVCHPLIGNTVHSRTAIPICNSCPTWVPRVNIWRIRRSISILQVNGGACNRSHHRGLRPGDFCIVLLFGTTGRANPTATQLSPAEHIGTRATGICQGDVTVTTTTHNEAISRIGTILRAKTNDAKTEALLVPAGLGRIDGKFATDKRRALGFHSIGLIWCLSCTKRRLSLWGSHIHVSTNPRGDTIILLRV